MLLLFWFFGSCLVIPLTLQRMVMQTLTIKRESVVSILYSRVRIANFLFQKIFRSFDMYQLTYLQLNLFLNCQGFYSPIRPLLCISLTSFLSFWLVSVITLKRTLKGLRLNQKESMLIFKQAVKCHHDLKAVTRTVLQQEGDSPEFVGQVRDGVKECLVL